MNFLLIGWFYLRSWVGLKLFEVASLFINDDFGLIN